MWSPHGGGVGVNLCAKQAGASHVLSRTAPQLPPMSDPQPRGVRADTPLRWLNVDILLLDRYISSKSRLIECRKVLF